MSPNEASEVKTTFPFTPFPALAPISLNVPKSFIFTYLSVDKASFNMEKNARTNISAFVLSVCLRSARATLKSFKSTLRQTLSLSSSGHSPQAMK